MIPLFWEPEMDYIPESPLMSGYAGTLPVEHERDLVAELHAVVAEVTGKPVEQAAKPRMGFL